MSKKAFFLSVLLGATMTLFLCGGARAGQNGTFFELGVGGGLNLNGLGSTQVLVAPALSIPINSEIFRLRMEGDLEMIFADGETMAVGGISAMLRASLPGKKVRPFVEIGPGVNYATDKEFGGRHLGGPFFFSAMGGLGIEVPLGGQKIISISYRARHLSNGNTKDWNQGYNSQYLMLSVSF
jgi:hypothetical protein